MWKTGFLPSQYASNTASSKRRLFNIISYIQIRCFGVGFITVPWYPYAYRTEKPKKRCLEYAARSPKPMR